MKIIGKYLFLGLLSAAAAVNCHARENDRAKQEAWNVISAGNDCLKDKNYSGAIENWNKAVKLLPALEAWARPHLAGAYAKRGARYYLDAKYSEAVEEFDQALKLQPDLTIKIVAQRRDARGLAEKGLADSRNIARGWWIFGPAAALLLTIALFLTVPLFLKDIADGAGAAAPPAVDAGEGAVMPPADIQPQPQDIPSLMREGKYQEALEIVSRKRPLEQQDHDYLLKIYIRLGDFTRARLTATQIDAELKNKPAGKRSYELYLSLANDCRNHDETALAHKLRVFAVEGRLKNLSPRESPEEFYNLAAAMERDRENELALKLYQAIMDTGRPYQQTEERYQRLKDQAGAK